MQRGTVKIRWRLREIRKNNEKLPEDSESILLQVSVRDTGIGIRKEDVGRLFEAFERLDEAGSRKIEGTGLGKNIKRDFHA
ncbi:MAG: hypothetical protein J5803_00210 [Desulfovibrio sp.]|nr:hypothetical protein [Desulfovibrio sp.]